MIELPVRKYNTEPDLKAAIVPERTAFLLVDSDEGADSIVEQQIHPALEAARTAGLKIVYLYNAVHGVGGPNDVTTRIHGIDTIENNWQPRTPEFHPLIQPLPGEAVLPKSHKDGFNGTMLDYYLKTWSIDTIIAVGFSIKSCLYNTCLGARHHNYRVVMLRDCTNSVEFPDTKDANLPEGGWVRTVFLRLYETDIGYTSTSSEWCKTIYDWIRRNENAT